MQAAYPTDIAGRASNLSERIRAVSVLRATGIGVEPGTEPDGLDAWRIDRLAGKLAAKFQKEALHRSAPVRHSRDDLVDLLTAYRRYETAAGTDGGAGGTGDAGVGARFRSLLADVHADWLPTYRSALDGYDPTWPKPRWLDRATQDGRLARAAEPFLGELGRLLTGTRQGCPEPARLDPRLVEDLQIHLLDRFELSLAWAVEADANVYCAEHGIDRATATEQQYQEYLAATFADAAAYHRFYLRFPVLGRWLAQVTGLLAEYGGQLLRHLAADLDELGPAFFGTGISAARSIKLGRSDYHAGARSVGFVTVELAGGGTGTVVYKPRDIRSELAMQRLLGELAADGVLDFATRPMLARPGYGYEALIPAGRNQVASTGQVAEIYRELGGYLAIFYVLGGGDLHFENVLVADGHAHICDCETALGVQPRGQARAPGTLLDSVFKTGLLEWPRPATATATPGEMRISGYAGGEGYDLPIAVPQVGERGGFGPAVTHRSGVHVEPDGANRVFRGDELVVPQDHADDITAGFDRVYDWFQRQPEQAVSRVFAAFSGASVRFINWGTQIYAQLLMSARHPRCLAEPLEVDLLANTLRTFPRKWDDDTVLADRELASMWRLDVPIFTAPAAGRQLVHDHAGEIPSYLETAPLDGAADRIRWLSDRNREEQSQYIAASLATTEVSSPAFVAATLDYAGRVGRQLAAELRGPDASAPWTSYQLAGDEIVEVDVEGDLYHGTAGIALFLGYLDHLSPQPAFRAAAQRALAHAQATTDRTRIGAFLGLGGLVYLLLHLHRLWGDEALLARAVEAADQTLPLIQDDKRYDVLGGAAGLIPVLLALADRTGGHGLAHAHRAAEHLLHAAETDGDTSSWPLTDPNEATANLTGFSHGTAGIGWALIMLGTRTGRADYIEAGRRAFRYEARHFDDAEQDWYDLRTNPGGSPRDGRHYANAWCNGAAGIGLARITSWAMLGRADELLLREAYQALAATMRNFPRLLNDTLCHGRAGNAELFLRFAAVRDEPAFQLEANVQAQAQWRNLDDAQAGLSANTASFFPGLLVGMSGFGLHFLRLARPDLVPSVLLLDPPAPDQADRPTG
ncbi:MAG TPA: type 2 lanthipeptide synthetase LanM family protein [Mycobacteriales bacterium]|nr:type 2 lanthipeptide synthetase LanM family protein [Mycobacteriales bacterium]